MQRRRFMQLGLAGAGAALAAPLVGRGPAAAAAPGGVFGHGVASGDPYSDRVMIWTRITPSPDATPGTGLGGPTEVTFEVAEDESFARIVQSASVTATAASDHTVKVDVAGLAPATTYFYRFQSLGETSPTGRTRTAPAAGSAVADLRFGIVSCSNWEGGYFSPYRHLALRDDLDLIVHLGDYIYEYEVGGYGPGSTFGRSHQPSVETTTLAHYRQRHAQYKTDPDLALLHSRYAFVSMIDDHEVADNSWAAGAKNHTEGAEGVYVERRAQALQAFFEWMPIRVTADGAVPPRVWRKLSFGGLADLFMLDERTYRSKQPAGASEDLFVTSAVPDDPSRTMLGAEQLSFLETGLRSSSAKWKLLGNGVMFAPLVLADLPDVPGATPGLQTIFTSLGIAPPIVVNGDQWDGYRAEQRRLSALFAEVGGVAILTGDIHSSWAAEIPADPGSYAPVAGGTSNAVEFVTPAVSSDSFSAAFESVGVPAGQQLGQLLPQVVTTAGPWFKYLDAERQGYGVFEVTAEHVQYDWHHVSDRTDPAATSSYSASWRSRAGTNKLEPARQLGARAAARDQLVTSRTPFTPRDPAAAGASALPATGVDLATPATIAAAASIAAVGLRAAARAQAGEDEPASGGGSAT